MPQRLSSLISGRAFGQFNILRLVGIMLVSVFLTQCSKSSAGDPLKGGDRAPNFSLSTPAGERVALSELIRKGPVLVNFWATWCGPCKAELPILNKIHEKYRDKGLSVVGISVEERGDTVSSFCRRNRVEYQVLLDSDGAIAKHYGLFAVPMTVVLDRSGSVVFHKTGAIDNEAVIELEGTLGRLD